MMEMIAITNRLLCQGDFQQQLIRLARAGTDAIILREKDLPAAGLAVYGNAAERIGFVFSERAC